ncbi:Os07g0467850 [Oryza sativa Japonica Group]|uniref:Os07g0467850 protein n=1 Tax=Oryza sativa subsp. japonica TaxID=39947 RepID=A0A0P0X5V1_ORYSJ|nr:hypothetical protein EE612_039103 [Oryza sativa]BAT01408.1 Os07g0467850 [Oryza sativa Japonica Group]
MILVAKDIGISMCFTEPDCLLLPREGCPNTGPGDQISLLLEINSDLPQQPQQAERLLHRDTLRGTVEHNRGHLLAASKFDHRRRRRLMLDRENNRSRVEEEELPPPPPPPPSAVDATRDLLPARRGLSLNADWGGETPHLKQAKRRSTSSLGSCAAMDWIRCELAFFAISSRV